MKLLERKKDVVTGATDLEDLHVLPDFPVFMGSVDHPKSQDLVADLAWSISRDSGLIQLKNPLPLDVLYQAQTTTTAVGALWMAHHKAFAGFLYRYAPRKVIEFGGAHGILEKEYQAHGRIPWTILEPNPSPIEGCNAKFIKGFFDEKFTYAEDFDTVVHSHVFEHMYEPDQFMQQLRRFTKPGTRMVFSVPNLFEWLEKKYTNCINFEHSVFLTEPYVDHLLAKHGFKVLAKEYFMGDHSIFYAAVRDDSVQTTKLPPDLYEKNKQLYLNYVSYHENLIHDLNQKLAELKNPVYLFGAHIFAQYLIAFGLDTSRIASLLDNDPKKQGRRLYGTQLLVQSSKILREIQAPVVILKAGVYNEEIRNDILVNINPDCIFLE